MQRILTQWIALSHIQLHIFSSRRASIKRYCSAIYTLGICASLGHVRLLWPVCPQLPHRRLVVGPRFSRPKFCRISRATCSCTSLSAMISIASLAVSIPCSWIRVLLALRRLLSAWLAFRRSLHSAAKRVFWCAISSIPLTNCFMAEKICVGELL